MIRLLLGSGENVNEAEEYGWTPLMRAAAGGDSEMVAILLRNGADMKAHANGMSSLLLAAQRQYPEVVQVLVERGCDVSQADASGTTALMFAVLNSDLKSIRALLLKGADPNARNKQGRTALFFGDDDSSDVVVTALVEAGADVDAQDRNDETALMRAVYSRQLSKVEILLSKHASLSLTNSNGNSALDIARRRWGPADKITLRLEAAIRNSSTHHSR